MNISLLTDKQEKIKRFAKFCTVGLSGVGVNMGVFWFFTRIAGLTDPYDFIAFFLGIEISTLSNFILNDIWTFRDRRMGGIKAKLLRALKFNVVSAGYFIINLSVYALFTRIFDVYDLLAQLIAIGIGTMWNFSLSLLWTWRKKDEQFSESSQVYPTEITNPHSEEDEYLFTSKR